MLDEIIFSWKDIPLLLSRFHKGGYKNKMQSAAHFFADGTLPDVEDVNG